MTFLDHSIMIFLILIGNLPYSEAVQADHVPTPVSEVRALLFHLWKLSILTCVNKD